GVYFFEASFAAKSAIEALAGPSLVIIGAGIVLSRFLLNRYAFTLTGIALLVQWGVPSFSFNSSIIQNYNVGPETLIVGGMIMVMGAILLKLYNTDVILKALHLFYRGRKRLTVIFKTALSYPGNKRFRTGATVAMFALVLLAVTVIEFLTAEQGAALDSVVQQDSGGYDIVTRTTLPVADLANRIGTDKALSGKVAAVIPFNSTGVTVKDLTSGIPLDPQPAVGGDPNAPSQSNFYTGNTFTMALMANGYKTATDVWKSVTAKNSSDIVWSFGSVNFNGPPTASRTPDVGDLLQLYYHPNSTTVLSKNVTVAGVLIGIFEAFLALGLVVGIAGLGIISIRSVVERRKEIGVLRAMGYRKNMILAAFLLENSYVALLGILIGIVLGIDLGYAIATSPGSG